MTRQEEIEEMASLFSLQHKVLEDFGEKLTFQEIAEDSFKCGAEWADSTAWKPANGDNLPEIDREVIALIEVYNNYMVVFAHRPNPNGDAICYDEGGWNQPNVKWWLDSNIEKLINNEEDNKR